MSKNLQSALNAIRLIRSDNIGPRTYFSLVRKFGSVAEALANVPEGKKYSLEKAQKEIELAQKNGIKILLHSDVEYPEILQNTYDPAPVLFYKGDLRLLQKTSVGIVGTRNASANGGAITKRLAADLGQAGIVVISGLARGIDSEAHKASLETGTIAVLAGGLDECYPPENQKLFDKIAEKGLLLSENPVGTRPLARHFPQRNRIVAGLSQGVLVVEAAKKSGSMITAEFASREGREVFAIPGSPLDPRCSGTNYLIKNGAVLVESVEDIIGNLHSGKSPARLFREIELKEEAEKEYEPEPSQFEQCSLTEKIMAKISSSPVSIDEIAQQTGFPVQLINEVILELELSGKLNRAYGNKVSLAA